MPLTEKPSAPAERQRRKTNPVRQPREDASAKCHPFKLSLTPVLSVRGALNTD